MKRLLPVFAFFLSFLMTVSGFAEAPNYINFQGKLTRGNGAPFNGAAVDILFRIYNKQNPVAGTHLWQELHTGVTVDKGVFNVKLGGGFREVGSPLVPIPTEFDPLGLPTDINNQPIFSALSAVDINGLWVEVVIGDQNGNLDTMSPLQELSSVAYAMYSTISDAALDVPGMDITPNTVTVNGTTVINSAGEWVGSPAGITPILGAEGTSVSATAPASATIDGNKILQVEIPKAMNGAEAVTLAPGTEATAVMEAGVLKIGIPQGLKGDKGDIGSVGAQGLQGIQGPKGDKGDKGNAGATGATGPQGVQGPKGDKGDPGFNRDKGVTCVYQNNPIWGDNTVVVQVKNDWTCADANAFCSPPSGTYSEGVILWEMPGKPSTFRFQVCR